MIVFPMAGLSSRFTKAGYDRPKWMLPLAGRPLLDWSLLSFSAYFGSEPFLIVYLDRPGVGDFVRERVEALRIESAQLIALPEPTRGQAETIALGLSAAGISGAEPLNIFNIDTIRPGYRHSSLLAEADGWLECFDGEGDHWSFVRPAETGEHRVAQVTEKVRVSSLCCSGIYCFRSADSFMNVYNEELAAPTAKELYVAPLYQRMIEAGADIRFGVIRDDEIFFSGTPDEYEGAKKDEARLMAAFGDLG